MTNRSRQLIESHAEDMDKNSLGIIRLIETVRKLNQEEAAEIKTITAHKILDPEDKIKLLSKRALGLCQRIDEMLDDEKADELRSLEETKENYAESVLEHETTRRLKSTVLN